MKELALKPTYWASVSGGKDSLYMLNLPDNYNFMIQKMAETEKYLSELKGKPVAIKQSNAKYNIQYIDNIVRTKYLKKLEEIK